MADQAEIVIANFKDIPFEEINLWRPLTAIEKAHLAQQFVREQKMPTHRDGRQYSRKERRAWERQAAAYAEAQINRMRPHAFLGGQPHSQSEKSPSTPSLQSEVSQAAENHVETLSPGSSNASQEIS